MYSLASLLLSLLWEDSQQPCTYVNRGDPTKFRYYSFVLESCVWTTLIFELRSFSPLSVGVIRRQIRLHRRVTGLMKVGYENREIERGAADIQPNCT